MVDTKKRVPSSGNIKIARPASARRAKLPKEVVAIKAGQKDAQGEAPPECEVLRELGRGSCGVAWLVRRRRDKKLLVMKSVALSPHSPTDEKAAKERNQAMREVQLLKEVKSTHVVQYAGAALLPATSKRSYAELQIFTEYCNGGDLATFLRRSQVGTKLWLPEDRVWKLSAAILAGLNELHRRQILHRDLKPANIFLHKAKETVSVEQALLSNWPSLTVKVGDLGVARPLSSAESLASTLVGTPYYCAPEVFAGDAYCNKADIYSFGVCVYELMHGKPPHGDIKNIAALIHKVLNLSGDQGTIGTACVLDTAYSAELRGFTQRCLARAPEERPSTSDAMLQIQIVSPTRGPSSGSQPAKAKRARTPGAGQRGSAAPLHPRAAGRAQSASPRTAAGTPAPQQAPDAALAPSTPSKRNGTKAARSPRTSTPDFKFQPRPRPRSSEVRSRQTQGLASCSSGGAAKAELYPPTPAKSEVDVEVTLLRASSEILLQQACREGAPEGQVVSGSADQEVEKTLRRSVSEGFFSSVAGHAEDPAACTRRCKEAEEGIAAASPAASSGNQSTSSLAFSETEMLTASLGDFTGLMDLTLPAPSQDRPPEASSSSWARRILARGLLAGDANVASPKRAWCTATLLPQEALEGAISDKELTLKRPLEMESIDSAGSPDSLPVVEHPEQVHGGAADASTAELAAPCTEARQEAEEASETTSGMHCKRFLQENRWRSGKALPGGAPGARRDEVVNYVAKAQDCWLRWRQEKRRPAAKQEASGALNLEVRGTALSPGTRRKAVAAA